MTTTRRRSRSFTAIIHPYLYLVPLIIVSFGVMGYALYYAAQLSLFEYKPFRSLVPRFVGFSNYATILRDPAFWKSTRITLVFVLYSVVGSFLFGTWLASLLNKQVLLSGVFRTCVLIPMMIAPVIAGLMWKFFMSVDFGFLNYILSSLGLPRQTWTSSPDTVLVSTAIVQVWRDTPFVFIIMLAGLQALPVEPFESARIDGANRFQVWRYITVPFMRPAASIVLVMRSVFSLRAFGLVYIVAPAGGPDRQAMVHGIYVADKTLRLYHWGEAATVSVIMLALAAVFALGVGKLTFKEIEW